MDVMDVAINIRNLRRNKNMTLESLAAKTNSTKGYLSQVENFRTLPSLPVLYKIAQALEVDPAMLLASNQEARNYILTKKNQGTVIEREFPESGFIYRALAAGKYSRMMDPFLLEIPAHAVRKNVTTNGDEFIYLLEGELDFRLGNETVKLSAGDSLYFEGDIPHHPENRTGQKAVLLVLYCIRTN